MNRQNKTPFATIAHINSLFAQTGAEIARLNQTLARVLPANPTPASAPLLRATVRSTYTRHSNPSKANRLTNQDRSNAIAWLRQGVAVRDIAQQFNVTRPTIYNLRDKYAPELNRKRGGYRHGQRASLGSQEQYRPAIRRRRRAHNVLPASLPPPTVLAPQIAPVNSAPAEMVSVS